MDQQSIDRRTMISAFSLALFGALYCVLTAGGHTEALCVTEGCSLYKEFEILGVSLWWWGAGGFLGLAALAVFRQWKLLFWAAFLGLALDGVLLLIMALTAPCVSCLAAGLIFCLVLVAVIITTNRLSTMTRKAGQALVIVWLILFSPNLFAAIQETAEPWALHGSSDDPVKLYFSPSCPACQEMVVKIFGWAKPEHVALYPVAEAEGDVEAIAWMRQNLTNGAELGPTLAPIAMASLGESLPSAEADWRTRLDVFMNKIALARMGVNKVPLMLTQGAPQGENGAMMDAAAGSYKGCAEGEDCD